MLYLLFTSLGSAAIKIFMRMSSGRVRGNFSLLAVSYLVCTLFSWGSMGFGGPLPTGEGAAFTVGIGLVNGCIYVMALFFSQYNISRNGVVLSTVVSRLGSLIIPLGVTILLFGELPRPVQVVGAVLSLVSVVALYYDKDHMSAAAVLPLAALFFFDGCTVGMTKIFNGFGNPAHDAHFLLGTFAVASLVCVILLLMRRERPGFPELLYGSLVGTSNFIANRCLLKALETVPAIIAYPTRCVVAIAVVAIVGVLCFGERLRRHQWCAMAAVAVAIVLLNL